MARGGDDVQGGTGPRGNGRGKPSPHTGFIKELRQEKPNAKPLNPKDALSGTDISAAYPFYQQCRPTPAMLRSRRLIDILSRPTKEIEGLSLKPRIKDGEVMDTAFLASMALLGVCIAADIAFGRTTGGERLDGLKTEYFEIANRTPPL